MLRYPSPFVWFCILALVSIGNAFGQTPQDNQLRELLKRFPGADANKDGKLTREEAQAYRQKVSAEKGKQADDLPKPTHADVKYGPAVRNVLDFYQAPSDKPTPLIIHIHGGGFVGGDKRGGFKAPALNTIIKAGISFASINYRFVDGKETIFPAPQHDGARAVQFLRSKAKEWNIDKNRIACMGSSAGAGISMWIGFHEDLADPKSDDPVLRESTRIQAIGTFGGQGTYNPIEIKSLVGGRAWEHSSIFKVYGATSTEELLNPTPKRRKLYDESSAITHLTKDDPPLYMIYDEADGPLPANARPGQGIHHPNFGRQLKKKMDELGIENVFVNVPEAKVRNPAGEMLQFFVKRLDAAEDSTKSWRNLPLIKNGQLDPNWVHVGWGKFSVEGDHLRTDCDEKGMGLLLYRTEPFGNCQIRVVYKTKDAKSNAGVYVRIDPKILSKLNENAPPIRRQEDGKLAEGSLEELQKASESELGAWYPVHHGFEVQICDQADPFHRTGAIYSLAQAAALPKKNQDEWRTMIITLDETRVLVDIDGERITTFDSEDKNLPPQKNWFEPKRTAKRPTVGYFGLQNHDPGDVVYFKEISVRPLR